jgi:hypothetical protein
MNKGLIRDLAITGGIYDCITDPYDKLKNGDPYSSVMIDLERFAEKIVQECIRCCEQVISDPVPESVDTWLNGGSQCIDEIKQHFGAK